MLVGQKELSLGSRVKTGDQHMAHRKWQFVTERLWEKNYVSGYINGLRCTKEKDKILTFHMP